MYIVPCRGGTTDEQHFFERRLFKFNFRMFFRNQITWNTSFDLCSPVLSPLVVVVLLKNDMKKDTDCRLRDGKGPGDETSKSCPMTGKTGTCPMTGLISSSPFSSGSKSIIAGSNVPTSKNRSFLWLLCPLHWSIPTLKLVTLSAVAAVAAWSLLRRPA